MNYKRLELYAKKTFKEEQVIFQNLVNKLTNFENLSIAEGRYICGRIERRLSYSKNKPEINALDYPQCNDCLFIDKYLLYFQNYEGWQHQKDILGNFIPDDKKREDISFLDKHYVSWSNDVINNFRIKNELLRHVHIETNRQLKALKEYCNRVGYGSNRYNYIAKGIIFHSKFLYLTVLEYYEETNKKEESITICGNKIIIDSYAYVHILFRHYAAIVKEHQVDKSYHIGDFDHKQLPNEIFNILDKYAAIVKCDAFDKEKIFFKLNKTKYALWWKLTERQFKGKPKETVFRVETLYPVEAKRDLNKIAHLKETIVSDELSIFL